MISTMFLPLFLARSLLFLCLLGNFLDLIGSYCFLHVFLDLVVSFCAFAYISVEKAVFGEFPVYFCSFFISL